MLVHSYSEGTPDGPHFLAGGSFIRLSTLGKFRLWSSIAHQAMKMTPACHQVQHSKCLKVKANCSTLLMTLFPQHHIHLFFSVRVFFTLLPSYLR